MLYVQVLVNGLLLGGLYACIAAGFSLVWGVLNVINILHGSFVVLGAYLAFFAYTILGIHPYVFAPIAALMLFGLGYTIQFTVVNRVIEAPVLVTMTATFGLALLMAFLGGVGTIAGPVFGAAIFVALEELVWRNVLNFHAGILGIIIVCLLVFIPGGLGSFRHGARRLRALMSGQTSGTARLRSAP
jgi:ABC-type branched-subunit amino acid transport system permease subunit